MVMPRLASLGVEISLGVASLVAFSALLVGGAGAGRVARRASIAGAVVALLAALATSGTDAVWLFEALRVDRATQLIKAVIAAGLLGSAFVSRGDAFRGERAVGPFFRLVAATTLAVGASAGDLLVLWIALDIASAAIVTAVATEGAWATREPAVRRLLGAWLPTSILLLLGAVLTAAFGGSTRYGELEAIVPDLRSEPVMILGLALVIGSILVRAVRFVAVLIQAD